MVKDGFGVSGNDIGIGADVLVRSALSDEFSDATGRNYDNDSHRFAPAHVDTEDSGLCSRLVEQIERLGDGSAASP